MGAVRRCVASDREQENTMSAMDWTILAVFGSVAAGVALWITSIIRWWWEPRARCYRCGKIGRCIQVATSSKQCQTCGGQGWAVSDDSQDTAPCACFESSWLCRRCKKEVKEVIVRPFESGPPFVDQVGLEHAWTGKPSDFPPEEESSGGRPIFGPGGISGI